MANKKKPVAKKAAAPVAPPASTQVVAEYILGFQDKKFTQNQINNLMRIYEEVNVVKPS